MSPKVVRQPFPSTPAPVLPCTTLPDRRSFASVFPALDTQ